MDDTSIGLVLFIIHIALCFVVAAIGDNRKIGFGWSLLVSFLIGPLLGLIVVLISKKKNKSKPIGDKNGIKSNIDFAINLSNEGKYEKAIYLLNKLLENNFNNVVIHYNLACNYSLINNTEMAILHLSEAIDHGYNNFEKIEKDEDLANLRNTEKFAEFADNGYKFSINS